MASRLTITSPSTGDVIREVPQDGPAEVAAKRERVGRAQPAWARTPVSERQDVIRRFAALVAERRDALAATLTSETGKPITQARNELSALQGRIAFFIEKVEGVLAEDRVCAPPELEERISYEPLGVVTNISAWNYPWFVGSNVFVPALLTGNAVLYKPSELATLTGLAIESLLLEAGLPEDVLVTIVGGRETGAALLEQPAGGIFFTGSHATGRAVAAAAARQLTKVQLELGGKDPAYVCDDVDVRATAEALADGAFYNTGQSCCSVERIYVHERVHDAFVEAFVETVRGFVVGDPYDEKTYIGPLTRAAQLPVLEAQAADAQQRGARLLLGGRRLDRPGAWFAPTVLANADHTMALMRDESFGPIIGIARVSGDAAATALMNDTEYGLTAAVYATDPERARRILEQVDAGSAYWNCCDRVSPRLPWSGRRHSGIGATLGIEGIRTFVRPKAWHLRPPPE
jgi:acyl-CoA reductase-like NAD-dependent aldehyde dehydrogenase